MPAHLAHGMLKGLVCLTSCLVCLGCQDSGPGQREDSGPPEAVATHRGDSGAATQAADSAALQTEADPEKLDASLPERWSLDAQAGSSSAGSEASTDGANANVHLQDASAQQLRDSAAAVSSIHVEAGTVAVETSDATSRSDASGPIDAGTCTPRSGVATRLADATAAVHPVDAAGACLPECIQALQQACLAAGTCVANYADPEVSRYCWSAGITMTSSFAEADAVRHTVRVSGSLCYSVELSWAGGSGVYTWRDSCGSAVAQGIEDPADATLVTVTCHATHSTAATATLVDLSSPACANLGDGAPSTEACTEASECEP